ncbi:MAG TPA: permease [Polyangiaceae bacterium]|nr:permease [Polyangiaceae bacterium]
MYLLLLSLVALACGPALTEALPKTSRAREFIDGLVLVALSGLVLVHILPHTVSVAGWPALLVAVFGFALPFGLERLAPRGREGRAHRYLVPLVLVAFGVHAFIDGAALVEHAEEAAPAGVLVLAIVLHRLPDGLAIWSVVRPARGVGLASGVLGALGLFTVFGFAAGGSVLEGTAGHGIALLQSFVAGSVLHVIVHRHAEEEAHAHDHHGHEHHEHAPSRPLDGLSATLGAIAGVALLVVVTRTHPTVRRETGELEAATTFVSLALEASPALLASIVLSALVHAFLPHGSRAWLSRGGALSQAARAVAVAPMLPQCSCGAVPLYRTLITKGTPVAAAIALLIAAPELGVPAMLVSATMLGVPMTLARVAGAALLAIVVGVVVSRVASVRSQRSLPTSLPPEGTAGQRLAQGLRQGLEDVIDHTGPWLVVGLAAGAFFEPLTRGDAIAGVSRALQVPLFAVAGMPLYVCASGATPFVAILMHKGLSAGAAVAFLVTGPASNVTTLGVLSKLHGRVVALVYVATITLLAVAIGYAIDLRLGAMSAPSLHEAAGGYAYAWWNVGSLAVVSALFLRSVVRRGPRTWFGQVLSLSAG